MAARRIQDCCRADETGRRTTEEPPGGRSLQSRTLANTASPRHVAAASSRPSSCDAAIVRLPLLPSAPQLPIAGSPPQTFQRCSPALSKSLGISSSGAARWCAGAAVAPETSRNLPRARGRNASEHLLLLWSRLETTSRRELRRELRSRASSPACCGAGVGSRQQTQSTGAPQHQPGEAIPPSQLERPLRAHCALQPQNRPFER